MRRKAALLGSCVIGLFLLTGCGSGGGDDNKQSPQETLEGTWRASRIAYSGQSTNCAGTINLVENGEDVSVSCGSNGTLTFFEDGQITGSAEDSGAFAGTWQFNNDTLTVNVTTPAPAAGTQTQKLSFSGDNTFSATTPDGVTVTFSRQ